MATRLDKLLIFRGSAPKYRCYYTCIRPLRRALCVRFNIRYAGAKPLHNEIIKGRRPLISVTNMGPKAP